MSSSVTRITHVITGLSTGGAETMLYKLLSHTDRSRFKSEVISLTTRGEYAAPIEDLGIPVRSLMFGSPLNPLKYSALRSAIGDTRPDVVQTWMYHADLLGGLTARTLGRIPVVWNIRASRLNQGIKKSTLLTIRLCAMASRFIPSRIICGSQAALDEHRRLGYDPGKLVVIPNGFDLDAFQPDEPARGSLRSELNLGLDALLIGLIARFDPLKDHQTFLTAASITARIHPEAHFVLCGDGVNLDNAMLRGWIEAAGVVDRVHLLGRRPDVPRITAALDIATLTSFSEGFPNVLGEAMSAGVPVVTTDVGDASHIVGQTGLVVPARSPEAISGAWEKLIAENETGRRARGEQGRERVRQLFSLDAIVGEYEALYDSVSAPRR